LALAYLRRDHRAIPFWRIVSTPVGELRRRAEAIAGETGRGVEALPTDAVPGAGTAPGVTIDSYGLSFPGDHTAALRGWDPPVIARTQGQRTIVDLLAVDEADDPVIAAAIGAALTP
jgi:L-seryl-tRNA(Ser) seleniumtransferase